MAESEKRGILSGWRNLALRAVTGRVASPIDMVWIPPGVFLMGSPMSEEGHLQNERQHRVTLTQGFWLGKYPITQGEWKEIMGNNPSEFKGSDRLPVENVSWEDCQKFIAKLNQQRTGFWHRLPTEAEWEYACRAGTTTPFHFGETISTDQANYDGKYTNVHYKDVNAGKGLCRKKTTEVGDFPPNAWGLYDMHGNVWEWCQDWYDEYPSGPVSDPQGPSLGGTRVTRGGSWFNNAAACRSAFRTSLGPGQKDRGADGFRVVRMPSAH